MTPPLPPPAPPWTTTESTTPEVPPQGVPASTEPVPNDLPADLIPGYLKASRIHLWGGSPHAGKTTLAVCLAKSLLTGEPFLGQSALTPSQPVPYFGAIFTDRPPEGENLSMFEAAGINLPYYSLIGDRHVDQLFQRAKEGHQPVGHLLLQHALWTLKPPCGGVVFIDVYAPAFTGHSLHDSVYLHRHMILNQQLVQQMGITVIAAVYGSKQMTDTKQRYLRHEDRIIGAAPLRGCASTVAYLTTEAESGDQGYQELTWVPRGQRPRVVLQLKRDPDSGLFKAFDLQSDIRDEVGKLKASRAISLMEAFPEGSVSPIPTAVFQAHGTKLGFSEATVRRYLSELENQGLIERVMHGFWRRREAS